MQQHGTVIDQYNDWYTRLTIGTAERVSSVIWCTKCTVYKVQCTNLHVVHCIIT